MTETASHHLAPATGASTAEHAPGTGTAPAGAPRGGPGTLPELPPGYAYEGQLGAGGMGVVYRAMQVGLNRPCAVKMILAHASIDSRMALRFLAEAEAVAAIRHPNVVQVYEFGDHAGRPFLAMEFLEGGSLADRLKAGDRLGLRDSAQLLAKVAAGVQAAHNAGIVHRDLKPGNVLLDAAGEPKVADFGLAKRGDSGDLTRTGAVLGSPAYMAPEQAFGAKFVGPSADIYALGVILFECLAGRRPFEGDSDFALLLRVRTESPPSPRAFAPDLPRDLEMICLKCLSKAPHERYPSASEFAADLGRYLAGQPVRARPVPPAVRVAKWARRNKALAGLVAAGLAVALAGTPTVSWLWLRAERAKDGFAQALRRETEANAEAGRARDEIAQALSRETGLKATAERRLKLAGKMRAFAERNIAQTDPLGFAMIEDAGADAADRKKAALRADLDDLAAIVRAESDWDGPDRASLLVSLGRGYKSLGLAKPSEAHLTEALAIQRRTLAADDPAVALTELELGQLALDTGDYDAAEDLLRALLRSQQARGLPEAEQNVTRFRLSWALAMTGVPEAEALMRGLLVAGEKTLPPTHAMVVQPRFALYAYLIDNGMLDRVGLPELTRAMGAVNAMPPSSLKTVAEMFATFQTGMILRNAAETAPAFLRDAAYRNAEAMTQKSLDLTRSLFPPDHVYLGMPRAELARLHAAEGKREAALAEYRELFGSLERGGNLTQPKVAVLAEAYAECLAGAGRFPEARPLFERLRRESETRFGPERGAAPVANLLLERAWAEGQWGDPAEAERAAREALAAYRSGHVRHPGTRQFAMRLYHAAERLPGHADALAAELLADAARAETAFAGPGGPQNCVIARDLARRLFALKRYPEALAKLEQAEAEAARLKPPLPARPARQLANLRGAVESARGRFADAERARRQALALARQGGAEDYDFAAADLEALAGTLCDRGRDAEAVPLLAEAVKLAAKAKLDPAERTRLASLLADVTRAAEGTPRAAAPPAPAEGAFPYHGQAWADRLRARLPAGARPGAGGE